MLLFLCPGLSVVRRGVPGAVRGPWGCAQGCPWSMGSVPGAVRGPRGCARGCRGPTALCSE